MKEMENKGHQGQALFNAVLARDKERVQAILAGGCTLNHIVKGDAPIHIAARNGDRDIIEVLTRAGVDINETNQSGNTALHFVARNGKEDLVRFIKDIGGDINAQNEDGDTPLHASVGYQPMDVIETYVKLGMDVNTQNKNGDTPLHAAVFHSRDESVEALLLCKADPDIRNFQEKYAYELTKNESLSERVKTCSLLKCAMESGYIKAEGIRFRYKDVGRPLYMNRTGVTIETMSLDKYNPSVMFYCRREKFENKSIEYEKDPEEEVVSDVYHFRVRDVISDIKATFTIPLYSEPSDTQELAVRCIDEMNGTQTKDDFKLDTKQCTIALSLVPEITTVVVVSKRVKVQEEMVGNTPKHITSDVKDDFTIGIPKGAFEPDTVMSLKVFDASFEESDIDTDTESISTTSSFDDSDDSSDESVNLPNYMHNQANVRFNPNALDNPMDKDVEGIKSDNIQYPRNIDKTLPCGTLQSLTEKDTADALKSRSPKQIRRAKGVLSSDVFQIDVNGHQPSKGVQLQVPLNSIPGEFNPEHFQVIRLSEDDHVDDMEVLKGKLTVKDGKVLFETEHFSIFVVCPIIYTNMTEIYSDIMNVKYRRHEARFFAMVRTLDDGITHVLMVECIKSTLSRKRRKHWRRKGFSRQKPKHSSRLMLAPGQEFSVEISGDAQFDSGHGETGQRTIVFSPHRASFQPYHVTLPLRYDDGMAAIQLYSQNTLGNVTPPCPDDGDDRLYGNKQHVTTLQIQLPLPPEEDPYGPEVEGAFYHDTMYDKRRRAVRGKWLQMTKFVLKQYKQRIVQEHRETQVKHKQKLTRHMSIEEEKAKLQKKRTLFPTDLLAGLFSRKGKK